jgi:hypothetical protein
MPIGAGVGSLAGGALGAISSLVGGGKASSAAKDAANTQLQMYNTTRTGLMPYSTNIGMPAAQNALSLAQGSPTGGGPDYISQAAAAVPPTMTEAQLEQTPGYQFNLAQGLKATQSAAASRGLGVSGASIKGAATYATGLADSTYQNQFNNAQQKFTDYLNLNTGQQTNLSNQFGRLNNLAALGESAAATTGQQGTYAASNYGNYLSQSGVLAGTGTINAANAVTGGINNQLAYQALANALSPTQVSGYSGPDPFAGSTNPLQ